MFDLILPTYNFSLVYARKLVEDIPDERLCDQPLPGRVMNHGAFTLGHLAWANDNGLSAIGLKPALGQEWKEAFAMGAKPQSDRAQYPSKEILLQTLADAHARLADAVGTVDPQVLTQPAPERMRRMFPTAGHMLAGLMTTHYGSHLGQLSAWRRASGFPSAF